ncbi:porin family protein [Psychroflexus sp. MES1-P1E]|uniref:porin family protein n=1 Tax=Psychroflexus sp. MES1-P1E TaxID=2058320 RepID=UPI000C795B8C|nr:porin family protein [Psychroflexus sp. MES1-P1E]PKG42680.1 hypothetical protein CXF67_08995 [Psychroflexus sp. MES1-P1E]
MKTFIIVAITLFSINCSSQKNLKYSIKGGINYTWSYTDFSANKVIYGFNIGGTIEKDINDLISVQTELNYNLKGIESVIKNTSPRIEAENRLGYIDIPVLFQVKFAKRISFQAGPQVGFLVYKNSEIDGNEVDLDITKTTFGFVGGFEIDFLKKFYTQFRYEYGLSKIIQNDSIKFSVISLNLGCYFN